MYFKIELKYISNLSFKMEVQKPHYNNQSTLYVVSGVAVQEQVEACVKTSFDQIRKAFPNNGYEKAHYVINVVSDYKGNLFGYAYIWVSDPRIYYLLLGCNADGTERYEEKDDPNWVEPKRDEFKFSSSTNWADMDDDEEEFQKIHTRPKLRRALPPLIRLPGYKYNEEQLKHISKMVWTEEDVKATVPQIGYLEVSRARVSPVAEDKNPFVLVCSCAPLWITEEMIRPFFAKYNTDTEIRYTKNKNGGTTAYTYPTIEISKTCLDKRNRREYKMVFVCFSRLCQFDAVFALLLTRKFIVQNTDDIRKNEVLLTQKKAVPPVRSECLIFNHSMRNKERERP
jgi:hypothetical protein